ncbi:hypothetical protein TNCV_2486681 [Trichonephila clavipes]|uniref:Uncharacterized protein n=1 Tax=Trichonephila clavipes TaxID=2585209 RepID=A0A8X7BBB5_TRICX|nr:hypothetical protein TNCV_2486681 [Trichonephila clavipes]
MADQTLVPGLGLYADIERKQSTGSLPEKYYSLNRDSSEKMTLGHCCIQFCLSACQSRRLSMLHRQEKSNRADTRRTVREDTRRTCCKHFHFLSNGPIYGCTVL